jgi:hypothetical protein
LVALEAILVDHAMNFRFAAEMKQEPNLEIRRAQVTEQLRRGIGMQALRRFDLENELLIDDHVECLPSERLSSIMNRNRDLPIDAMAFYSQVSFQRECVDVFPKSESERLMDVMEHADDRAREGLFDHRSIRVRSHATSSLGSDRSTSSDH